jgi:hypothetical protein
MAGVTVFRVLGDFFVYHINIIKENTMTKTIKPMSPGKGLGRSGPRPYVWKCGPDAYRHQMYTPWMMAKSQANYRGEEWLLPFDDFFTVWDGSWHQRGRASEDLCMTRIDYEKAWHITNVHLVTRKVHCNTQSAHTNKKYRDLGFTKRIYKPRGTK